jgi:hypothetical protein
MNRKAEILSIFPILVQRDRDWFAVTPPDSPLRVGVEGGTEGEARERFQAALSAWAVLAEEPGGVAG